MYRTFAPLFLLTTIMAAPQDAITEDAAITYVKMQPITEEPIPAPSYRSSRIENIPLTIPASSEQKIEDDILDTSENNENRNERAEPTTENYDSTETTEAVTEGYEAQTTPFELKTTVYEPKTTVYEPKTTLYEPKTTVYEPKTTLYEPKTKVYTPKPKAPKFYSKLSYFEKPNDLGSVLTNLVDRSGRRKFRSKCRCEKISNCPKLQITVPRCPEEQFLCCF